MAEVGLVAFARIARRVAEAVVPAYKSKHSKRVFTQLVFVICLRAPECVLRTHRYRRRKARTLRRKTRQTFGHVFHGLDNRTLTSSPSGKALNLIHVFALWKVNVR
jgi:hypothetical protein